MNTQVNSEQVMEISEVYGISLNEAKTIAETDNIISKMSQAQAHIENNELAEAIEIQQDCILWLLTKINR